MLRRLNVRFDVVTTSLFQLGLVEVDSVRLAPRISRLTMPIELTASLIRPNGLLFHLALRALLHAEAAVALHIILHLRIILILPQIVARLMHLLLVLLRVLDVFLNLFEFRILVDQVLASHSR